MSHSLDRLASYLEEKPILIREFLKDRYSAEQIRLLEAKGFYPYEHTDSFETLQKTDFSPQEAFCSSLTESSISSEDYQWAQNMWREFNIQNLDEYMDLYMKCDILLLSDVFQKFKDACYKAYRVSAAGLSYDDILKYTCVKLELLTEVDKLSLCKSAIRGGVSQTSNRFSQQSLFRSW